MDKAEEISLIGELRELAQEKRCFLDEAAGANPVWKYTGAGRFEREQARLFRAMPRIAAHASELPSPDSFLRREIAGLPVLFTRDSDRRVHAFLNVCRHRGARLVDDESGCRDRFTCPYHAWSYSNRGKLLKAPFADQGFPDLDVGSISLKPLACEERHGWVWVVPDGGPLDLDAYLGDLDADLAWLDGEALEIKAESTTERRANWKILIEGGIEAYHFRVVHRRTIGPHFPNNLSSYRMFGDHIRSILPRAGIAEVEAGELNEASIRDKANVLYTFFPLTNLLAMPDHIVWIHNEPLAPDRTRLRISTLAPKASTDSRHWERNNLIAQETLAEDGEVGESIQSGIAAGANDVFQFGRFEGALTQFNATIDRYVADET
jgi:phenylpropionate dioxygenase-like ring-hydroxylating dioxygenase large terminal subunit